MTHFEALQAIFASIRADRETVNAVVDRMELDPELSSALARLRRSGWDVVVMSAGCEWYIRILLGKAGVDLPVFSNPGRFEEGRGLLMELPRGSPFFSPTLGIDKAAVVRHGIAEGRRVAFAGDGFPDLDPARLVPASLRFARGDLARVLERRGPAVPRVRSLVSDRRGPLRPAPDKLDRASSRGLREGAVSMSTITQIAIPSLVRVKPGAIDRLGVYNYESIAGALPPPMVMTGSGSTITWTNGWSVHGRILPLMEQGAAFNAINFTFRYSVPDNTTVSSLSLSSFLCPSEIQPEPKLSATARLGVNNYGWNMGDWYVWGGFAGPPIGPRSSSTGAAGSRSSPTA